MTQEAFWTMIGAIAQVVGSIATFAAVLVALKLASEERQVRLRVRAGLRTIVDQNGQTEVVAITIENIGHRNATIESLAWTTGYVKRWIRLPACLRLQSCHQMEDYEWTINERFPWMIEPGKSKTTVFRRQQFIEQFSNPVDGDLFRKLPFGRSWILLNYRVGVGVTTLRQIYFGEAEDGLKAALEAAYLKNTQI
jgi:hypothetical protein